MHSYVKEAQRLTSSEFSYCECRLALKYLLLETGDLSDVQALSRKALYQVLVKGSVQDDLINELGLTKQTSHAIWPWQPGLKYLTNDETTLTKLSNSAKTFFIGLGKFIQLHPLR